MTDNSTLLLDGLQHLTEVLDKAGMEAEAEFAASLYQVAGQVVVGEGDSEADSPCALDAQTYINENS